MSEDGELNIGDKSTPEEIWEMFPGMSKSQFKGAVGALLREGIITTSPDKLTLVEPDERVPLKPQPYNGKAPQGWRAKDDAILFIANLPFTAGTYHYYCISPSPPSSSLLDKFDLAKVIEAKIGYGKLASVKIGVDPTTGMYHYPSLLSISLSLSSL